MKTISLEPESWDETNIQQLIQMLRDGGKCRLVISYQNSQDINHQITHLLNQLGVSSNLKGYSYLRTAIKLCVADRSQIEGITRGLYPKIAEFYATNPEKVEHAMRHAIEKSWIIENKLMQEEVFGRTIGKKIKPSNSVFIATLADYLQMERFSKIS